MTKTILRAVGPYTYNSGDCVGRKYMQLYYTDGSKGTTLYSRWLMSEYLGRPLDPIFETVDHIDEDKTNDSLSNLQLLSLSENSKKAAKHRLPAEMYKFDCPICGTPSEKKWRHVKHNWKRAKVGPFCGRKCSRQFQIQTYGR